ncbi:alpha/beta hydrolase [Marinobacterium lutimaris]|uniref:Esterase/lipase superfamily enzyme n=1 Tax=Marinobacterium lutimaris TaxID=568106 RepID=A0A1H5YRL9_9GAMM|nr:alpha/beta hydrolase [Marinobacterium lutimaris]SEG26460.1 Esterase/lipase superfamily enzyme [Marinobacterium lutimaris]
MGIRQALRVSAFTALFWSFSGLLLAAPAKHALLIGISDYTDSGLSSLPGAENDIQAVRQLLEQRLGFPKENIELLLNKDATHSAVVTALQELSARVQQDDLVYIHYSGYGSNMPDLNGDEASGLDKTWVTFGARSDRSTVLDSDEQNNVNLNGFDLLDDEIDHWLAPAYAKAAQLVFVTDTAHWGTVSRGDKAPQQRAAANDSRMHPLGMQSFEAADRSKAVFVSATQPEGSAYEYQPFHRSFGLFTWHWLQSLASATPDTNWRDLLQQTQMRIKTDAAWHQSPSISGNLNSAILNGELPAHSARFRVTGVTGDQISLDGGQLAGLTPGSTVTLANIDAGDSRIEITETDVFSAKGVLKSGHFSPGDALVLSERSYPQPVLRVFVSADKQADSDSHVIASIRDAAASVPGIQLDTDQRQADLVLYYSRIDEALGAQVRKQGIAANLTFSLPDTDPQGAPRLFFLNADETEAATGLTWNGSADNRVELEQLKARLGRIRDSYHLHSLAGSSSDDSSVDLNITHLHRDDGCTPAADQRCQEFAFGRFLVDDPRSAPDAEAKRYQTGDVLAFGVANRSTQARYVYLLSSSPDGDIKLIYPTPEMTEAENRIDAQTQLDQLPIAFQLDRSGTESIKMIASTEPIDRAFFEPTTHLADSESAAPNNALERLLAYNRDIGNGQKSIQLPVAQISWSTANIDLTVAASGDMAGVRSRGADTGAQPAYVRVRVFFGSNRNYDPHADEPGELFGNDRGTLRLGSLWVSIPANHEPGKLETPSLLSLMGEDPSEHVMLQSVDLLDKEAFVSQLGDAASQLPDRRMLLYIHGYNNSFEEAARRSAQIAYDLSVENVHYVPLLFTWPSGDSIIPTQYTRAWTNKEWAVSDLVQFLELAVLETGIDNVHVLAHSMGTNLFSSASLVMAGREQDADIRFGEVLLAAPDIDAETFYRLLLPRLQTLAERTTVYMASQDVALHVSKVVHSGYRRLGDSSDSPLILQGVDVVDVSELNTSDMGHAYYAAIRELLSDIGSTLRGITPDLRRLSSQETEQRLKYWSFQKAE